MIDQPTIVRTKSPSLIARIAGQPGVFVHVLRDVGSLANQHSRLIVFMAKREITDRFAGSILGVVWSVAHPLIQMIVYAVVFALIFRGAVPDGEMYNPYGYNFAVHMISGFLAWTAFTDVVVKSCTVVSGSGKALAKNIVFPIEILPIKTVLASLVPQLIGTVFLVGYTFVVFGTLPWTWVFWPFFLACEFILLCGIAYIMAALGVFVRDLREVIAVLVVILFYATPILYSELQMPNEKLQYWLGPVLNSNPISYLIWPFRDIAFHGTATHFTAWIVLPIGSVVILVVGFRVFRKLKPMFANAL